jgi:hypothetical protein
VVSDPYAPTPPAATPARAGGSGWAWFFAGTTLALALMLAGLLWALATTGLYSQLISRLDPSARRVVQGPAAFGGPAAGPPAPVAARDAPAGGAQAPPASAGPATPPAGPTGPTQVPRAAASAPSRTARLGEVVESGDWKLLVNSFKSEPAAVPPAGGRRIRVDFTIKNDQTRAATLTIPATIPLGPRARPASLEGDGRPALQPVQLAEPPALRLEVVDRAERTFGGGFASATGQVSGSYTFEAAPGDAIRLTYVFDLPADAADPLALDASFGVNAGGQRARVSLDGRADPAATLAPSDPPKSAGPGERLQVGSLWAMTTEGIEVGGPAADGQRTVTARLRMENLSDQPLIAGGTLDDPTGGGRDFYAVDAQGQLAYSGADTMPRTIVPARQSRTVQVRLRAPAEFATSGPHRLSVVVDALRDRYAVFKLP